MTIQTGGTTRIDSSRRLANIRTNNFPNEYSSFNLYMARAWVNFRGDGAVTVRASGNVTSVTDLGLGSYQVNFTTAMINNFYVVAGAARRADGFQDTAFSLNRSSTLFSSLSVGVATTACTNGALVDSFIVSVVVCADDEGF